MAKRVWDWFSHEYMDQLDRSKILTAPVKVGSFKVATPLERRVGTASLAT